MIGWVLAVQADKVEHLPGSWYRPAGEPDDRAYRKIGEESPSTELIVR